MHGTSYEELDEVASQVTSRYCRKCWWAERDAVYQECWLAFAQAANSFDPNYGVPFAGYAMRAAYRWVRGFLWKQSSPVTASSCASLQGLQRAPTDVLDTEAFAVGPLANEETIDYARYLRDLEDHVWHVLQRAALDHNVMLALLSKEVHPKAIAESLGMERKQVYSAINEARSMIASDPELRQLWREG